MSSPLLLDDMFSDTIAQQLRANRHDVLALVTDLSLMSLPDDQILAHAAATGRALVTANIKDFMPLDAQYRAGGQAHAGLILISAKTFPQDRSYTGAVARALGALLDKPAQIQASRVIFLPGIDLDSPSLLPSGRRTGAQACTIRRSGNEVLRERAP